MKKPFLILIVAAFAAFLATFNEPFLNIVFTPIMQDFNIGVSTVQWLTTAYMLGAAIMVPISSFLFRKINTKPFFLFIVGILITGSLICCFAPNFQILLIGRIIQSLGTGMLIPVGMNMTMSVVPKEKIGSYMGIMGAATTFGPSLSIISAGFLLTIGSWRLLFYVFTTLTIMLFIIGTVILDKMEKQSNATLDTKSVSFISIALIGLLYGISTLFTGNILLASLTIIIGIIFLTLFVQRQNKLKDAFINLKPLKIKEFKIGIISNMGALMLVFAMNIIMPLYIQNALNVSAFTASLTLFPAIIFSCIISPLAGKLYDKHGAKEILPFGFTLMFIFILLIALTRNENSLLLIGLLYIPVICGSALIIGPAQSFALSNLDKKLNSHGVTMISTGFQIAGCIGSSVFTGIYSLVLNIYGNDSLSFAFLITLITASIIALLGFILSLSIKK